MVCDTEMVYCFDYFPTVWECEAYLCDKPIAKIVKLTNACFAKMILLRLIASEKRGLAIVETVRCDF